MNDFSAHPDLPAFLNLLHLLVREPSVVGTEDAFFRAIRRELEELDLEVRYYQGVLVAQGKRPHELILSAHVDRHGLVCTGPNEFQYAAFVAGNQGELSGDSVSEQLLQTIEDRFSGERVQAHEPFSGVYLGQGSITKSFVCPERRNLIFEVQGLDYVAPGTPLCYLDRLKTIDGTVTAQLDNVLSVALLIFLFRKGFQGTALFTAQEEAGRSWRYARAWFQREQLTTQRLLVLDTSPFPDRASAEAQEIVLRRKDASAAFAPEITEELAARCRALGISFLHKDEWVEAENLRRDKPMTLGRTELGRLAAATGGALNGTTLQIPTTGYHTPRETASLRSLGAALSLLQSFLPAS
jgi:putative aminopeptidase FrvX